MPELATHKTCSICQGEKPLADFPDNKLGKFGKQGRCRDCEKEYVRAWSRTPRGREKQRRSRLKCSFGITVEEYEALLESQGGVCAICGGLDPNGRRLAVDHDHETDAVRGLLCGHCNTAIGLLSESSALLLKAARYLAEGD